MGIRTALLATTAVLGISGDFVGTLGGSAWYQRGLMIACGALIFVLHLAVEMLSTREDRLLQRRLEDANDALADSRREAVRLRREKADLQENISVLEIQLEARRRQLANADRDFDALGWLASAEGRAALDGLRDFSEKIVARHGPQAAESREEAPEPRRRPLGGGGALLRVATQAVAGILAVFLLAFLIYGIEVYLD
ncbi:hypothetical protein FOF52_14660 [Thermobifida alba]|mgnify:CR=1 FL=1|uniref:Uncharacterized protein n=1 Tax=Thermobifida alba TaxID=53522 RepID=A0ABY4L2Z3_THEAE|nr:hypothetical protein [Thermobifida alba]UPT22050.1 hypothetical protein FOF52_14660 [Thermobifida alba]